MATGIVKDRRFLDHNMGPFHVESPMRLDVIYKMIDNEITFPLVDIAPRPAEKTEVQWIHSSSYIDKIKETSGQERTILDPDTSTSALSYEVAMLAVGGLLEACKAVMEKKIQNGFALIRPPGHHAEISRAMGFCLFNNVAVAAEYLLKKHGLHRILIVDWDLHHGNGTQNSFYNRKDVLYFSTHQYPHYPGSGHWSETGQGPGEGFTVNIPLSAGKGDSDYRFIYKTVLSPIVDAYCPEFILVSAGFDIYEDDPLGGMSISASGFGALASDLMEMAARHCSDRILFTLEGGYDFQGLKDGVKEVLGQLIRKSEPPSIEIESSPFLERELRPVFDTQSKYWKF
jgi:acetoin utilization deacetylase AcuC-like enzyme